MVPASPSIVVAGAGAFGLTCALRLAQSGARVTVVRPEGPPSASFVAAGMLAPAMETLFDAASPPYPLLAAARDQWPALAEGVGLPLDRSGGWAVGEDAPAWLERLHSVGARGVAAPPPPGLAGRSALFTPEDWRLDASAALAALQAAFESAGGVVRAGRVKSYAGGVATLGGDHRLAADHLLVATGYGGDDLLAPEAALLAPIKGQILRASQGGGAPLTVRGADVYVCRDPGGVIVGATMQPGRDDLETDPGVTERLSARATALMPELAGLRFSARAGVRAATPDGLPLVGWSRTPGVLVAIGARRNGWLLAPMVAERIAALAMDQEPDPLGAPFNPGRFSPAG